MYELDVVEVPSSEHAFVVVPHTQLTKLSNLVHFKLHLIQVVPLEEVSLTRELQVGCLALGKHHESMPGCRNKHTFSP